jgi:transposase
MYPFYLGIDLHLKRTYAVLMDHAGKVIDERRIKNLNIKEYLKGNVPQETYAVLEATRNWAFMYDLLDQHVAKVALAHPKELKAIANAAVKTDQIDAKVLANLARLNFLPISYAAPKEIRDLRLYVRHREWLIRQRTQSKNRIHAVLARYNLVSPTKDLFGVKGREYLSQVREEVRPTAQRVVDDNLVLIDRLDKQIEALEEDLQLSDEHEKLIKLLKTMPGVGRVTATIILAEIGDIVRFNSPKALCNWAGLTPKVRKSDRIVRHGRISKQGSPYLRAAMTRAATVASRISPRWSPKACSAIEYMKNCYPDVAKKALKLPSVAVCSRWFTLCSNASNLAPSACFATRRITLPRIGEPVAKHGSMKPRA